MTPCRSGSRACPTASIFAEAASLPVIYLHRRVRASAIWPKLEAGETRADSWRRRGGVGVAAIHYARHRGAQDHRHRRQRHQAGLPARDGRRACVRFAQPRLRRRRDDGDRRCGRRCRAELARRRGDGAQPRLAQAVRPVPRTRQARLLSRHTRRAAPAAAEYLLFRGRCRPARGQAAGARPAAACRNLDPAGRGRDSAACAPALSLFRDRRCPSPDAGVRSHRQAGSGS